MRWQRVLVSLSIVAMCAGTLGFATDTPPVAEKTSTTPVEPASVPPATTTPAAASGATTGQGAGDSQPAACTTDTNGGNCPVAVAPFVPPSARDLKAARHAFAHGLKLQKENRLDEAFPEFEEAARLAPEVAEYLAAREMTRERLASQHIEAGNGDLLGGKQTEALAEFREALSLDPQNEFAQQRLQDAAGPQARAIGPARVVAASDSLTVKTRDAAHDIHYSGDSRGLLTTVASSFGLSVVFDDSFVTRHVRFEMEQGDFAAVLRAATAVTKSFCVPLEDTVLFAAADTPENHKAFDRMGLRTFYVPTSDPTKELQDVVNSLRNVFEFRFVSMNTTASTVTVRGPINMLRAATEFMAGLDAAPTELLLDVSVMEVDHTFARNIGLHIPNQFNLYNIPASALAALGGQNVQQLINELISGGSINQAGNQSIAALLAQLQGQQNSIFSQPLATFGGGITLMGLSLDQLAAALSLNESSVQSLEHVTLRASQNKESTFKVGARYPVLNASFSPISNSAAIAGVLQNQSYLAPFPSVNYEDIGLSMKVKPVIHHNSDVALEISFQFRALGATNVNGVPIINNREFTGGILLKDGEPAFIAGMITGVDQRSLDGLPLFAQVAGFGILTSQHSRQSEEDELLILITPHVVSDPQRADVPPIWLSK